MKRKCGVKIDIPDDFYVILKYLFFAAIYCSKIDFLGYFFETFSCFAETWKQVLFASK